eukprot:CAMPEP_0174263230 /NCGR_PEP_ID=MMETSP0439-20130205/17790_1 /TAXON_ID=0 /ORGANISM="Stereomyxa ramosa, Strain Chinc5" /LENGTH=270 /DNA_ID=CAMNT_0015348469 /DNA_START=157 /DNA_END=966 /DNA_ORIENTATION=+
MDMFSPEQLTALEHGGNSALRKWFKKYGIKDGEIPWEKYHSACAAVYRDKLRCLSKGNKWNEPKEIPRFVKGQNPEPRTVECRWTGGYDGYTTYADHGTESRARMAKLREKNEPEGDCTVSSEEEWNQKDTGEHTNLEFCQNDEIKTRNKDQRASSLAVEFGEENNEEDTRNSSDWDWASDWGNEEPESATGGDANQESEKGDNDYGYFWNWKIEDQTETAPCTPMDRSTTSDYTAPGAASTGNKKVLVVLVALFASNLLRLEGILARGG